MSYVLSYNQEIHPKIFRCLPANLILCDKMIREDKHTRAMTRDEKREHDYTRQKKRWKAAETLIIDNMLENDNRFTYSTSSPSYALAANMATSQELSTFEHAKGLHGCFLLTNTTAKFYYGRLLHNISWLKTDDKGTFLMSNGIVNTYF